MIHRDDRTPEQRATHTWLVIGTDSSLSGWGEAASGASVAAWACRQADRLRVLRWVRARSEMKRVREVSEAGGRCYRPRAAAHFHVYVVRPGHPSLAAGAQ